MGIIIRFTIVLLAILAMVTHHDAEGPNSMKGLVDKVVSTVNSSIGNNKPIEADTSIAVKMQQRLEKRESLSEPMKIIFKDNGLVLTSRSLDTIPFSDQDSFYISYNIEPSCIYISFTKDRDIDTSDVNIAMDLDNRTSSILIGDDESSTLATSTLSGVLTNIHTKNGMVIRLKLDESLSISDRRDIIDLLAKSLRRKHSIKQRGEALKKYWSSAVRGI